MSLIDRKPQWLKKSFSTKNDYFKVKRLLKENNLNTVCSEALCPNKTECWNSNFCTFLILGKKCTRHCKFCNVRSSRKGEPINDSESNRIANLVLELNLKYVVITSVTRDDLPDGGAKEFIKTIEAINSKIKNIKIELLIPDFSPNLLDRILITNVFVIGHNLETVERLTPHLRDRRCSYKKSLEVLEYLAKKRNFIKSSIMVGLGEKYPEVVSTLKDLRNAGVSIVTIGQYLRPSEKHIPVYEYVHPDVFSEYATEAKNLGFKMVFSDPFVRSSYMAEKTQMLLN